MKWPLGGAAGGDLLSLAFEIGVQHPSLASGHVLAPTQSVAQQTQQHAQQHATLRRSAAAIPGR